MFDRADQAQLADLGISAAEVERQLQIFTAPPPAIVLDRPCTVGDGIDVLGDAERRTASQAHAEAAAEGRLRKFVPASGAATRMFQALLAIRHQCADLNRETLQTRAAKDDKDAKAVLEFADNLARFAFAPALAAALARSGRDMEALTRRGEIGPIIDALLGPEGLDYNALPKALILFHRYGDESRTAFEEHLLGAGYARSAAGKALAAFHRLPEHDDAYRTVLAQVRQRCDARAGAARHRVLAPEALHRHRRSRSRQPPAARRRRPSRLSARRPRRADRESQRPVRRHRPPEDDRQHPAEHLRATTAEWLRLLTGHLVAVQRVAFAHCAALDGAAPTTAQIEAAHAFAHEALGAALPAGADAETVAAALHRPLRVAGMVRNSGEPGGGPFWVRDAKGTCTRQIVESAQVDMENPAQRAIFASSTHFNPVLIVCGLRDWRGRPFELREFVDPGRVHRAQIERRPGVEGARAPRPVERRHGALAYVVRRAARRDVHAREDRQRSVAGGPSAAPIDAGHCRCDGALREGWTRFSSPAVPASSAPTSSAC
jgi:hypothetical protein